MKNSEPSFLASEKVKCVDFSEKSLIVPKMLYIEFPYDLYILLQDIYAQDKWTHVHIKIYTWMSTAALPVNKGLK